MSALTDSVYLLLTTQWAFGKYLVNEWRRVWNQVWDGAVWGMRTGSYHRWVPQGHGAALSWGWVCDSITNPLLPLSPWPLYHPT